MFHVGRDCIQDQRSIMWKMILTMKLSVNEANLPVCDLGTFLLLIQLILISKFAFGPERLSRLSRNGPLVSIYFSITS